MSIINDALKKVQSNLPPEESTTGPADTPLTNSSLAPAQKTLATLEQEELAKKSAALTQQSPQTAPVTKSIPPQRRSRGALALAFLIVSLTAAGFVSWENPAIRIPVKRLLKKIYDFSLLSARSATRHPVVTQEISPPNRASKVSAEIVLQGIMTMNNKQVALINDEIYEKGSVVQGKKILNIFSDRIELEDQDKRLTITLYGKTQRK